MRMRMVFTIASSAFLSYANAQTATSVNVSALQRPVMGAVTPAAGGSLASGTYYYVVTSVDSLGGESSYRRGTDVALSGSNHAVVVNWSAAPFAKHYRVYRNTEAVTGAWQLVAYTDSLMFTDLGGSMGANNPRLSTSSSFGTIRGNGGIDVSDEMGWNTIKTSSLAGYYANYPATEIGGHFTFGTSGIYGGNGGLLRAYQGIMFEGVAPYGAVYMFKDTTSNANSIYIRPRDQSLEFVDAGYSVRSRLSQGIEDGPSAIAFLLSSYNQLSNPTAKLLSIKNENTEKFSIAASGNVGICVQPNDTFRLNVNGKIKAQKLYITQNGWSDYVFDERYELRPLAALEKYITANKHLPDVPSAKEVERDGISVGDNQAVLLRKIEELTLYILQQEKRIASLEQAATVTRRARKKNAVSSPHP